MGPDTIWIFIPLAGMALGAFAVWNDHKQKLAKIAAEAGVPTNQEDSTRLRALEDRVQVLERIVTDKGYDVATQIEALRDQRRVDDGGAGVPLSFAKREQV